jgi:hypothetical protein
MNMKIRKLGKLLFVLFVIAVLSSAVFAASEKNTQTNGNPFKKIWDAISILQNQVLLLQRSLINITGQLQNLTGIPGPQGPPGLNGTNGRDGVDGINGTQGPIGPQGIPGVNGTNGREGRDGIDGINGTDGAPGPTKSLVVTTVDNWNIQPACCPEGTVRTGCSGGSTLGADIQPQGELCCFNPSPGMVHAYCLRYAD